VACLSLCYICQKNHDHQIWKVYAWRILTCSSDFSLCLLVCQMYRDYRNLMVNKYRENVERRLTPSDLRTVLVGEHTAIYRVWSFLDHWGLINFQAKDGVLHEGNEGPAPFKIAPSGTFFSCLCLRECE
jgi:hypothetical protein